jgi:hypothetical protein
MVAELAALSRRTARRRRPLRVVGPLARRSEMVGSMVLVLAVVLVVMVGSVMASIVAT